MTIQPKDLKPGQMYYIGYKGFGGHGAGGPKKAIFIEQSGAFYDFFLIEENQTYRRTPMEIMSYFEITEI